MQSLGRHLIVELYGCDVEVINNTSKIESIMCHAAEISGATIVQPVFHKFAPHGISGVVVVAESHFAIHTWPEYGYCAVDIFTCGDLDNPRALEYLKQMLCADKCEVKEVRRGVLDVPGELKHKVEVTI